MTTTTELAALRGLEKSIRDCGLPEVMVSGADRLASIAAALKQVEEARLHGSAMCCTPEQALKQAREALELMLKQFTRTPSTFNDSDARCIAHKAIAAIDAASAEAQPSQLVSDPSIVSIEEVFHDAMNTGLGIVRIMPNDFFKTPSRPVSVALTNDDILKIAVKSDLVFDRNDGCYSSPYIEDSDIKSEVLSFARAILAASQTKQEQAAPDTAALQARIAELEAMVAAQAGQSTSASEMFQNWYTSISIEGDMKHNMQRAFEAGLATTAPPAPANALAIVQAALEAAAKECERLVTEYQLHSNFMCSAAIRELDKQAILDEVSK